MENTKKVVAIVGRPNVGKSTLFNILSTGDKAIVHSEAGVTRDTRRVPAKLFDLDFTLLDTAGQEIGADGLAADLNRLSEVATQGADILLFMVDGAAGILPADEELANRLRTLGKPLFLLMNKSDTNESHATLMECPALGLGEAISLSAAHTQGLEGLYDILKTHIPPTPIEETPEPETDAVEDAKTTEDAYENTDFDPDAEEELDLSPLPLAIVGRPNVGKSTFVNRVLNEERMLAGDLAGLTRESIGTPFVHKGRDLILVDTPGLRKKAKVTKVLEGMSVNDAITAIKKARAVLLILDASHFSMADGTSQIFEQQDARIAEFSVKEGKPLIIVLNKWDLVSDKELCLDEVRYQLGKRFSQVQDIPLLPMSAERGKGISNALTTAIALHDKSNARINTGTLNRFLEGLLEHRPPPLVKGKVTKIKYMTQIGICPPAFAVFGNRLPSLPESYKRYILNQMREAFGFEGMVVRLFFKNSVNPFKK